MHLVSPRFNANVQLQSTIQAECAHDNDPNGEPCYWSSLLITLFVET
jgi:hypothetical protein